MGTKDASAAQAALNKVLDADRALRRAQVAFLEAGAASTLLGALKSARVEAFGAEADPDAADGLIRMADLLLEIGDLPAARELVAILAHDEPAVRVAAGENLVELGFDRYADVARAIEEAVDAGTSVSALCEVPFILGELGEPGGVKLCQRLLDHKDADVVGAAIEGLALLGDPAAAQDIARFKDDRRLLTADDEDESAVSATVGDLAKEALESLRGQG